MKRLHPILSLLSLLWWSTIPVLAQDTERKTAFSSDSSLEETARVVQYMNRAMRFQQAFPQERVYIHFDNTAYFKNERIWMKAYVTRTDNGQATNLSRVLYVDLLYKSGEIAQRRILKIEHGEAEGCFELDSIIGTGFFEVRAYTRYMLNFGAETAFSRVLPIFRIPDTQGDYTHPVLDLSNARFRMPDREVQTDTTTLLDPKADKRRKANGYHVNLYPEGGNMVVGLPSRVALQATNRAYEPSPMTGQIEDSQGTLLARVSTGTDGRAIFNITPTDTTLTLTLYNKEGECSQFDIDSILREGCTLRVNASEVNPTDVLTARLMSSPTIQGQLLGYTVMNNGNILHADTLTAEAALDLSISRSHLRPGVNQWTFYNSHGQILAERLFFICPPIGENTIQITTATPTLQRCGKVDIDLQTRPHARLSLSAVDATTLANGNYGDIRTYMLLSSDLRGYIPHPERYFEADDAAHRQAADTLMLFNGWRRYRWEQMTALHPWPNRIEPIEDSLYIYGELHRTQLLWKKNNPVDHVELTAYLYGSHGDHYIGKTVTDSTGYYAFSMPDVEGDYQLKIETRRKNKLKTYTISIDRQFAPTARYFDKLETQMLPLNRGNLFIPIHDSLALAFDTLSPNEPLRRRIGSHEFLTQTVQVKKKKNYWLDYSGGWYNESDARLHADIYYDIEAIADAFIDRNETCPTLASWLCVHNKYVRPDGQDITLPHTYQHYADNIVTSTEGLKFDNRPIVWMANNQMQDITGINRYDTRRVKDYLSRSTSPMGNLKTSETQQLILDGRPSSTIFLDEVHSLYISATYPFAASSKVPTIVNEFNPVTIFIYLKKYYTTASNKGRRCTTFHGFNKPQKFQAEDYATLPPQPYDNRRTLHWEPTIEADAEGRAHVSFYNNYTCREILISTQGLAPDGTPLCNE